MVYLKLNSTTLEVRFVYVHTNTIHQMMYTFHKQNILDCDSFW